MTKKEAILEAEVRRLKDQLQDTESKLRDSEYEKKRAQEQSQERVGQIEVYKQICSQLIGQVGEAIAKVASETADVVARYARR